MTASTAPVTHADISIIQSLSLSDMQAATRQALNAGAWLYFDWLNLDGGVNGRTIHLVARDGEQKVKQTVRNVRDVAKIDNPMVALTVVGAVNVRAFMRNGVPTEASLPLVSPTTEAFSTTGDPLVFPIRADYRQEIDKMVSMLVTAGVTRISVLYQDNALDKEVLISARHALKPYELMMGGTTLYPHNTASVSAVVDKPFGADLQATFLGATAEPAAQFTERYRTHGDGAQLPGLSPVDPDILLEATGIDAVCGYSLALVVPNPDKGVDPVIREFNRVHAAVGAKDVELSLRAVEDSVAAKALAEAVCRVGPRPTRDQVRCELAHLRSSNVGGGFVVDFSDRTHPSSHYVGLNVMRPNGLVIQQR